MAVLPSSAHEVLLSSITSTDFRKIVIRAVHVRGQRVLLRRMELWASVDRQLCELVDRLRATGHCHTLEVELRFTHTEGDLSEICFTKFLSGFREKGVVTVIDATCGHRVLHSSTHDH